MVIVVWTLLMGLKLLINKPRFKSVNYTIDVLVNQDELLGGDIFEGQVLSEALSAAT